MSVVAVWAPTDPVLPGGNQAVDLLVVAAASHMTVVMVATVTAPEAAEMAAHLTVAAAHLAVANPRVSICKL